MPLNHYGKTIKSIRHCKDKVIIRFEDGSKMDVSFETFTSFYLFKNKELSNKDLKEIEETESIHKYIKYALNVLNKTHISESKMREKLFAKGSTKNQADKVIATLKENSLIDDKTYMIDLIEYGHLKLYGEKKIKKNLIQKGISNNDVNKIIFNENKELKKASMIVDNFQKKYNDLPNEAKKEKIYMHLLSKGYSCKIALKAIENVKIINDDKLIENKLKTLINAWINKNGTKYDNDFERNQAMFKYLQSKKYKYSQIRKVLDKYYGNFN